MMYRTCTASILTYRNMKHLTKQRNRNTESRNRRLERTRNTDRFVPPRGREAASKQDRARSLPYHSVRKRPNELYREAAPN